MYPSLALSAALLAPAAPVPRDATPNATGPAPRVLALKADQGGAVRVIYTVPVKQTVTATQFVIEGNQQVQKNIEYDIVNSTYYNRALGDFNGKFATADGAPLTLDEALARVKNGATLLASADGKPVGKAWLGSVAPDTVVMVAEGLSHANVQWGGAPYPNTPQPKLLMLGTDDKGTVQIPTSGNAVNNDGVYYDDIQFEGRGGRAFGKRAYYGGNPAEVKVVNKPLAEANFDAYDMNGKLVSKSEAVRRLAAGGLVLVAGDSRMPDEAYLKGFRQDVLVLVGSELVIPIAPLDQTKKKPDPNAKPAIQHLIPNLPAAQVAPALPVAQPVQLPAIKQPAIIRRNVAVQAIEQIEILPDVQKK